ncbi:DNA polymerase I [Ureibacillus sp. GCM10028918]|uniref:DNA polymerase I n=1 Tax=Ureibacillus sp. GCM10028918 TaxID=3273429 RepID=UPI003616CE89
MYKVNQLIQNILLAFIMSCSITSIFRATTYSWLKFEVIHIPLLFIVMFCISLFVVEDVRDSFKKVLKFESRKDKRPIWQVGVGMIFYFTQVGIVEVFARSLMVHDLGGMPLYLVFAFMNAFLLTVIYEEIFYPKLSKNQTPKIHG